MNLLRTILLFCATFACRLAEEDIVNYRLPIHVQPDSYSIKLQPFIREGYFNGETYIKIKVHKPVNAIYIHGNNLNISEAILVGDPDRLVFQLLDEYELIKLFYEKEHAIREGEHTIYFKYHGSLLHTDQMGLVKAMEAYNNGTEVLVVSDFQPTYARRAFPCFDEPAFKAIFNYTLITPDASWIALANTDEIEHTETPEGVVYRFETTPLMSTDLTSFAFTQMGHLEKFYPRDDNRVLKIRTFLGNAREENETWVLNFAAEAIKYFEVFTEVKYPMNKIDFLEYDKKFTATEYWGLTTFKRGLLNPTLDLYDTRQISIVVAHELTHYWFGNLVTNKWWNDIWLQEGFAQYLSHKVVDAILNMTNVQEYPLDYTIKVLKEDRESENINPVVARCVTPKDIMVQFNDITYVKAGSIIRLLDYLAGDDGFTKIIRRYFKNHSYSSATTEDFISAVECVMPNRNLREFLETWLFQNRYPLVTIEDDAKNNQYVLRQESVSAFKNTDNMSSYGYKWEIPIIYTTNINRKPTTVWFNKDAELLTIPKGNESFIKLNYNFMGIYLTNYTATMWNNLIEHVQMLNELEQAQLTLEAEKLFQADVLNCDICLKLIARVTSGTNQYGVSPLSVLYTLRDNLSFDNSTVSLLRKFFYSVRAKSKLARRSEEDSKNYVARSKRSFSFYDKELSSEKVSEVKLKPEPPNPRYIKCSKWIHENLSYLI